MASEITEFELAIPQTELDDLQARLVATRFPEAETTPDWSQGLPLSYARELVDYWRDEYDWRTREQYFNTFPQFKTELFDLEIHFLHVRSKEADAKPLLMTHGWPGSVVEFLKVIGPLTDPVAHGGNAEDAFDVVVPSLPGFGFSDKPSKPGWDVEKIARAWNQLMLRLGYDTYFAQGGDWGSAVTTMIALLDEGVCRGIHLNMPSGKPTETARTDPDDKDKRAFEKGRHHQEWGTGYSKQQSTRPQTIGYALADSPVGQAMWIIEKFYEWTDCDGHPENVLSKEEMLDNVMFYWLPDSGTSSAKLYWESFSQAFRADLPKTIEMPVGCSIFPEEIVPMPKPWAEQRFSNIVFWEELDKGGHFAAFEQPELFVTQLRDCFRMMD